MTAKSLALEPLLRAGGGEPAAKGTATVVLKANGRGASPRALAAGTVADVTAEASNLVLAGQPPRNIPSAKLTASIPGLDKQASVNGNATFEGEAVTFSAVVDPIGKIAGGERFAAKINLDSQPIKASYDGAVQQRPAMGLDGKLNADIASVGKLLAWLGQPLPKDQPDPGPLTLAATMAANGPVIELKQADIKGKALQATANGSVNSGGSKPIIKANIDVNQANLDAYLPAPKGGGKAAPAKGGAKKGGQKWSTEPIDFSALSAADGRVVTNLKNVQYRGLNIASGQLTSVIENGVMTTTIKDLQMAEGSVNGVATINGAAKTPTIKYDVNVSKTQARPLLKAFADVGFLSGVTEFRMKGQAAGASEQAIVSSLTGDGEMRFFDGAIHGVNLASVLRSVGTLGFNSGGEQKTDFAELGGTFDIKNGKFANLDFKMLAPLLRLGGKGTSNLPGQTIDYNIDAKLVDTLKGQGGDSGLAGLPIPIHIGGTYDNPTFDIDWKSVLQLAATDPSRLKALPDELLGKAKGLGVNLGSLGDVGKGGVGDALKGVLPGGKTGSGGVGDVLKALPGGKSDGSGSGQPLAPLQNLLKGGKTQPAPAPQEGQQSSDTTTQQEEPKPAEQPADKAINKALKGLFGR